MAIAILTLSIWLEFNECSIHALQNGHVWQECEKIAGILVAPPFALEFSELTVEFPQYHEMRE